jgi:CheY-like chemotaxis protein
MAKSLRIAVADDEPEVLQYFVQALARGGHNVVVTAEDGKALVNRCRAERPDLLITDIRMEGMSGIEAMRELAKDGPLPTILISAHHRKEDIDGQYSDQVAAFMPKPVKLADLLAAVAQVAERLD